MLGTLLSASLTTLVPIPPMPPAPPPDFRGLDFLVGGIWLSASAGSKSFASEMVYRTLGDWFLMSHQATISPAANPPSIHVIGVLGADPSRPGWLIMNGFASIGATIQLECPPSPATTSWRFEGAVCSGGERQEVRQQIDKIDANNMRTSTSSKVKGKWVGAGSAAYIRC